MQAVLPSWQILCWVCHHAKVLGTYLEKCINIKDGIRVQTSVPSLKNEMLEKNVPLFHSESIVLHTSTKYRFFSKFRGDTWDYIYSPTPPPPHLWAAECLAMSLCSCEKFSCDFRTSIFPFDMDISCGWWSRKFLRHKILLP